MFITSYCNPIWVDVEFRRILHKVLSCSGAVVNSGWKEKLRSQPVPEKVQPANQVFPQIWSVEISLTASIVGLMQLRSQVKHQMS